MVSPRNVYQTEIGGETYRFCLRLGELDAVQTALDCDDLSKIYDRIIAARKRPADLRELARVIIVCGLDGAEGDKKAVPFLRDMPFYELHDLVLNIWTFALVGPPTPEGLRGKTRAATRFSVSRMRALWQHITGLLGPTSSRNGPSTNI